ncbi:MAG: tetratricopeptide repeat protein [Bradyrhizobium sp.]
MSELFDEVDEEVRREQLKKLWDRYSIYIIAGALLIIAAVGGWRGYQYLEAQKAAEAGAAFDAAIELSEQNKHAEAEAAFDKLAARAPSGYRVLARLRAAAEVATRDPKAGAKLYDEIAADRSVGTEQQDLARIRAAGLLLDSDSYPDMLQRLEAAAKPEAAFHHTAREFLALSAWRANDTTAARQWLDLIANDGETPAAMRSRAEALQALLPPAAKS